MQIITRELLSELVDQARLAPRRRKNFNLHPTSEARCHRLLNAVEPDSYIRPHRHLDPEKDETFLVVQGRLGVILFDEGGTVTATTLVGPGAEALAIDIPHGVYHGAVSLTPGTVFFEAKAGPYLALSEDEKAPWAPDEAEPSALGYLEELRKLFSD